MKSLRILSPTRAPAAQFRNSKRALTTPVGGFQSREKELRLALAGVLEPFTGRSIVTAGLVQKVKVDNSGKVMLALDFLVPGYPTAVQTNIIQRCHEAAQRFPWVQDVQVQTEHRKLGASAAGSLAASLKNVEHVIAVSSCKGGVGKSTIAANLAVTLAQRGLRVGLLDADIYGPSIPLLVPVEDRTVFKSKTDPKAVLPLVGPYGLKILSFGHVNPKAGVVGAGGKQAAIIRGPVVSRVINQLIASTEWGDLDYLVVDMPPGTGDIQITLSQSIAFSGAVIVSTPHLLSVADAVKGVSMFGDLNVPTLALVENMSYFMCAHGETYYPFGKGGKDELQKRLRQLRVMIDGKEKSKEMSKEALEEDELRDHKASLVAIRDTDSQLSRTFRDLADDLVIELLKQQMEAQLVPILTYLPETRMISARFFTASSAVQYQIPASELRRRDPITGKPSVGSGDANVYPLKFDYKGNYGVAVAWSDGHFADIFSFEAIKQIGEELAEHR